MSYLVKEVAEMVGITVRTLHHYDNIGLLTPETTSPAGYRLYNDGDLERLQQILFFREIGFELREIKQILENPEFNRKQALQSHRELLLKKRQRLDQIISTVDKTIETMERGIPMAKKEMFSGFSMEDIKKHQDKYAEEVRQKYDKKVVQESERKTAKYNESDWAGIMGKADEIYKNLASLMDEGPNDPRVQQAVGEWRQHITDNFYNCTPDIFRGLGDMYVADERFTANIDKYRPGLATFLGDAIHIYCDNLNE